MAVLGGGRTVYMNRRAFLLPRDVAVSSCVQFLKYYFGAWYFQNAGGSCVKSSAQGSTRALVQKKNICLRTFKVFIKMHTFPLKSLQKTRKSINGEINTASLGGGGG